MSASGAFWRARLLPAFLVLLGVNLVALAAWTGPRYWRQQNAAARGRGGPGRGRTAAPVRGQPAGAVAGHPRERGRTWSGSTARLAGTEKADLLPTLEGIEELARSPGLKPGTRALRREDVEDARVERVAVTLPLEGSYEQLVGFLREVEGSPRFLTVDRVAMRADRDGGGTLQVELSTYLRQSAEARKARPAWALSDHAGSRTSSSSPPRRS